MMCSSSGALWLLTCLLALHPHASVLQPTAGPNLPICADPARSLTPSLPLLCVQGVPFRADLCPAAYLCRPAQVLEWASLGLPSDQLCTENAIILHRFNRFPLVIDPSGQVRLPAHPCAPCRLPPTPLVRLASRPGVCLSGHHVPAQQVRGPQDPTHQLPGRRFPQDAR